MTSESPHQERFSKMTRMLFDRSLQFGLNETSTTLAPTPSFGGGGDGSGGFAPSPTDGEMINPPAPSPGTPSGSTSEEQDSDFKQAQPLIFLIVALLALFLAYQVPVALFFLHGLFLEHLSNRKSLP